MFLKVTGVCKANCPLLNPGFSPRMDFKESKNPVTEHKITRLCLFLGKNYIASTRHRKKVSITQRLRATSPRKALRRTTKKTIKQVTKWREELPVNNYFECKQTKWSIRKTKDEGDRMNKNARPIHMLPIRDSFQTWRHIHNKNEGMEKHLSCKSKWQERVAILASDRTDFLKQRVKL